MGRPQRFNPSRSVAQPLQPSCSRSGAMGARSTRTSCSASRSPGTAPAFAPPAPHAFVVEEESMSRHSNMRRSLAIAALALIAGTSLVPMVEASHRRYRGPYGERVIVRRVARPVVVRRVVPRGSYAVWHSGSGPVVAGFLSGLFLGATLTHAAPQGFVYWDAYCHEGFASLEAYDV